MSKPCIRAQYASMDSVCAYVFVKVKCKCKVAFVLGSIPRPGEKCTPGQGIALSQI